MWKTESASKHSRSNRSNV